MTVTSEPEPEGAPEIIPEPEGVGEPHGGASDVEILLPTAIAIFLALIAVLHISIKTQKLWWRTKLQGTAQSRRSKLEQIYELRHPDQHHSVFLDEKSWAAVDNFKQFQNKPSGLLRIMIFPACSLTLCPITLYLYSPLMKLFWPDGFPAGVDIDKSINNIIYSFLIPSGLIYATTFGFAFHETTGKKRLTNERLSSFCGMVNSACHQIVHSSILDLDTQRVLLSNLGTHTVLFMKKMTNPRENFDVPANDVLSDVIRLLQRAAPTTLRTSTKCRKLGRYNANTVCLMQIFSEVEDLQNHIRSPGIKPLSVLQWLFLDCLAFIAYFGILLVRAKSATLELLMCFFTVFSISSFTYVLADMDCPFHGLFRVTLTPLVEALEFLGQHYIMLDIELLTNGTPN